MNKADRIVLKPAAPGYTFRAKDIQVERLHAGGQVGNSCAVRLPAAVVEALELKEGDEIELHLADARQLGVAQTGE